MRRHVRPGPNPHEPRERGVGGADERSLIHFAMRRSRRLFLARARTRSLSGAANPAVDAPRRHRDVFSAGHHCILSPETFSARRIRADLR